jgi:hypothetical protein
MMFEAKRFSAPEGNGNGCRMKLEVSRGGSGMGKLWIGIVGVALAGALLVSGCGYKENNGTQRDNIMPKVFVTNFPPASDSRILTIDTTWDASHTRVTHIDTTYDFNTVTDTIVYLANPRIYWYGTDEDGRVDAFEYAVIPTDSLVPHPSGMPIVRNSSGVVDPLRFQGNSASAKAAADSLDWTELLPPNVVQSATVFLFADIDTSVAIDQFLFVRAIDNLGLRSEIEFARYSRQNHPPESYIDLDTIEIIQPNFSSQRVVRSRKYFSLPQSTVKYPGITIGWSGSDSLDFPDEQPPFEFNWVLYGPYPDKTSALPDSSKLIRTNDNLGTPRIEWTGEDRHTFFNLRSGWYVFEVRARDDAFVSDPTPAIARFQVVEPSFVKNYLLMDATNWTNGALLNAGSYNFRDIRQDSLTADTIRAFYEELFSNQGYSFVRPNDLWYRQTNECPDCYSPLPDRDVIGTYKAVIVYDEDMQIPLDRDNGNKEYETVLSEYMNVGGRVIVIGRNLFARSVTGWEPTASPIEATFTPADWAWSYFGLSRMFFPGHLGATLAAPVDLADFTSTIALDPSYPPVAVDTIYTLKLSQLPTCCPDSLDRDGDGVENWRYIPDVNWIGIDRNRGAEGFYQFNSYTPNTSPSQGRICGARFEFFDQIISRPTYRTAIMTFPLSLMKRGANQRAMVKELLDYILQ